MKVRSGCYIVNEGIMDITYVVNLNSSLSPSPLFISFIVLATNFHLFLWR